MWSDNDVLVLMLIAFVLGLSISTLIKVLSNK